VAKELISTNENTSVQVKPQVGEIENNNKGHALA